jgi:ABC-type transporter Mla subunit MlaD
MFKHGIDQEALIGKFSDATAKQGEAIRKTVTEATLKALQGRELSLTNIKQVLNTVAKAASTGAAGSTLPTADVEALLAKAVAGMDSALEQAVQANRKALQQMVDQGATLRETQVKKALADIEKMEDTLFAALRKAAEGSQASMEGPWAKVLNATQGKGTSTGAQASATITQLMDSAQQNLRDGRSLGLRASQAMFDSYSTLVSGVLIGMSDALQQGGAAPPAAKSSRKK